MKAFTTLILSLSFAAITFAESFPKQSIATPESIDRITREVVQDAYSADARLNQSGRSDDDDRPWRKKHPIAYGALVGLGCGAGYTTFLGIVTDDINVPIAMLFFGGIGAGIGALIGSFF